MGWGLFSPPGCIENYSTPGQGTLHKYSPTIECIKKGSRDIHQLLMGGANKPHHMHNRINDLSSFPPTILSSNSTNKLKGNLDKFGAIRWV